MELDKFMGSTTAMIGAASSSLSNLRFWISQLHGDKKWSTGLSEVMELDRACEVLREAAAERVPCMIDLPAQPMRPQTLDDMVKEDVLTIRARINSKKVMKEASIRIEMVQVTFATLKRTHGKNLYNIIMFASSVDLFDPDVEGHVTLKQRAVEEAENALLKCTRKAINRYLAKDNVVQSNDYHTTNAGGKYEYGTANEGCQEGDI